MITNDIQGSLKEALYETLTGILSPHYETRKAAEQRLQALEVTEEFGIHLTEFVVDPNEHLAIRQLASVLLKQYVEIHWSSLAEKFRPPELNNIVKQRIKELLPLGLQESISKVIYLNLDYILCYTIYINIYIFLIYVMLINRR